MNGRERGQRRTHPGYGTSTIRHYAHTAAIPGTSFNRKRGTKAAQREEPS